jgi:AraC-like DNA-binding protein
MRAAHLAAPGQQPEIFSTAGLPDARRIELWESHNAAALIGLSCHTKGQPALEATELNLRLGQVQLARVAASPHVVERTPRVVRQAPADAVAIYLTIRGTAWFEQGDGPRSLRPGHILICDADQPFARGFDRGLEELAIKVPRAVFAAYSGRQTLATPVIADFARGADPYARALVRLAGQAARPVGSVAADERAILELVAVLAARNAVRPALAHRVAARAFIEERLADPGLSAGQVAAAIGVSERHLSRVFAADGTSIPRHVLGRRLQLAYTMLADPVGAGPAVEDVSRSCGFTSAAYFSHVFRDRFGERAADVRQASRYPGGPAPSHFRHPGREG